MGTVNPKRIDHTRLLKVNIPSKKEKKKKKELKPTNVIKKKYFNNLVICKPKRIEL